MYIRQLLKALVLPPAINLLAILFALFLWRWRWLRNLIIALSLLSLTALSLPYTAAKLAETLEVYPPLKLDQIKAGDYHAIVVLGAGRHPNAFEYDGDTINALALQRVRYAAYIQNRTGLPIMTAGGIVIDGVESEAAMMAAALEKEFFAVVPWREENSRTTWENALGVKEIVEREGLGKVLLVTHAWHMPRAVYSFRQAGVDVEPAPTMFRSLRSEGPSLLDFVPQAKALRHSTLMLHEMLGLFWYRSMQK